MNSTPTTDMDMITEQSAGLKILLEPFGNEGDGVTISLEGMLTIEHVTEIYQKTEMAMTQFARVNIQLSAVEEIDLSVIQLFFYLQILADEAGNHLNIQHHLPQGLTDLIDKSGLDFTTQTP
ncbi:STAS domain-containing protein [Reichenbachiella agarivorans]|uniref:STAS domain-containing protein n=1 Tax=Reichenbachiella agarivorans TaxID=2979464 RepID=A0ABY6CPW8_9BACT|nr:STAS domain-containing protein [Reichenbachiella agarivorans]UXP32080.1 STAS domain-containing protein [Reichenbachiella agarivorans]